MASDKWDSGSLPVILGEKYERPAERQSVTGFLGIEKADDLAHMLDVL
jgi:hypothetical protein